MFFYNHAWHCENCGTLIRRIQNASTFHYLFYETIWGNNGFRSLVIFSQYVTTLHYNDSSTETGFSIGFTFTPLLSQQMKIDYPVAYKATVYA